MFGFDGSCPDVQGGADNLVDPEEFERNTCPNDVGD